MMGNCEFDGQSQFCLCSRGEDIPTWARESSCIYILLVGISQQEVMAERQGNRLEICSGGHAADLKSVWFPGVGSIPTGVVFLVFVPVFAVC